MAASTPEQTPEVSWAQRSSETDPTRNILYVSINAPDVEPSSMKLDIQPTHFSFSGYSDSKKATYKVHVDLFTEIDPAESKSNHSARGVDMVLRKKEAKAEYWPRLTKEKQKLHFLRTDFDKWVDEDEQDEKKDEDPYAGMGGMEGMEGMGGMGGMSGMGGLDFSKLGAGGDMPDFSSLGAGGAGGDDDADDDDDEDMPELENESAEQEGDAESKGKGKEPAKIEEVS